MTDKTANTDKAGSAEGLAPSQDPIQTAHQWLEEAATLVGLDPKDATALVRELLDLTKDVAHNRSRPAAPLTAYLVGLASQDIEEARQHIATLKKAVN